MNPTDPAELEGTAYLSLQNPCNASCPMCLSWRDDSVLTAGTVRDALRALADEGWQRVIFTGGEFVTHPDFDALLTLTGRLGLDFGFITNGTVLEPGHDWLLDSPRLAKVVYSRDFADPERHATWRKLPAFPEQDITQALARISDRGVFCQLNTVLMPTNADDLADFTTLPFWPSLHLWHLIPVKGAIARTWNEETRRRLRTTVATLHATPGPGPTLISPLPSGFADIPLTEVRTSRPTGSAVRGRSCTVELGQLYIDASGHVLPCNSIAWEERRTIGFGNLHEESAKAILARRRHALATAHNSGRLGCHACDPLNFATNIRRGSGGPAPE
ncbi:radical SAM protein [Streptomyces sp. PTM05]|uniref:Radical SAM protein n=1 Tax=Streptantibioticus parmotrematis TaxID=2873249 RepID=A0ABS7QPH2_9ACTN|nr:radical SAM protein [Streptantibioticus parmotrematis]MBY8883709.1 radical SAM protein [Streptantibioticus parmotrematis]